MAPNIKDIEEIFFQAMKHGYAKGDVKKITIPEFPNLKVIPFEAGEFKVHDCYLTIPGLNNSTGSTTIRHNGIPVWIMYYGGWYEKYAIPFLKECLLQAYKKERFYGGRGLNFVQNDSFIYTNKIEQGDFANRMHGDLQRSTHKSRSSCQ